MDSALRKSNQIYHLGVADYAIFVAMLLISMIIGIYFKMTGGKQRTTNEYLLANNSMGIFPVAFSLMASFMSAITLLGVSAEIYMFGSQFVMINLAYIIGTPIAAFVFLPVFFHLKVTSVYQYLEMRFNRSLRTFASSIFLIQMIFYMAIVLYAPALALSAVTGTSKWTSIISVGAVCTIYCTLGGMKAVLWTDVFQSVLMFVAMIIIIVQGTIDVGGMQQVYERALNGSRIELFNFDLDPTARHTVWNLSIGGIFIYVSLYGVNQTQIQRLLTVQTLAKSQIALFISWVLTSLLSVVTILTGLVIYANYWRADPLKCGAITKPDQLLPYYVVNKLARYPGVPGLIIAGIFSGSLSTVSSFVNSLSAVTLEDYLKPIFHRSQTFRSNEIVITKILAFFYGCLCIGLTYLVDKMAGILQASLTLFGVVGGPLLMLFTVGMCFRVTNATGAMIGFVASLAFGIWIGFGCLLYGKRPIALPVSYELCATNPNKSELSQILDSRKETTTSVFDISYMWFAASSWFIGVIIALLVSWLTDSNNPRNENKIHEPQISANSSNKIQTIQERNAKNPNKLDHSLLMPLLHPRKYTLDNGLISLRSHSNDAKQQIEK